MVALVTGANRGIGLEFCGQLKKDGYEVIGVCRKGSQDLERFARVEAGVDVTDVSALQKLATKLRGTSVDLLILNAGIFTNESLGNASKENMMKQLEVNSVGPVLCADAFLPLLAKGAKIGIVTSLMGSIADNTSGGYYGYRMSKAAVNAAGMSLAQDLKSKGIAVALLHPGYVKTDMTEHQGHITPQESVEGLMKVLSRVSLANTGTFWHTNGETLPW